LTGTRRGECWNRHNSDREDDAVEWQLVFEAGDFDESSSAVKSDARESLDTSMWQSQDLSVAARSRTQIHRGENSKKARKERKGGKENWSQAESSLDLCRSGVAYDPRHSLHRRLVGAVSSASVTILNTATRSCSPVAVLSALLLRH
jgi:hypothetical protein